MKRRSNRTKIVMVASEVEPYAKSGGLGDVLGALPKALAKENNNIIVIMPKYKMIAQQFKDKMHYVGYIYVDVNWRHQYCGVFRFQKNYVTYYFLDNEFYFGDDKLYNNMDLERFSFLNLAVFELLKYIRFRPDIIHAHDWQTGVLPALLKYKYGNDEFFKNTKTVYTIHNLQYQGKFDKGHVTDMLPLPNEAYHGDANFMKMGIIYADKITTVSPTYKEEIKTSEYGEGLEYMLRDYYYKLEGILNGIDDKIYNPEIDDLIDFKFNKTNYKENKKQNKDKLLNDLSLSNKKEVPLIGIITRLAGQKGIDLILQIMAELLSLEVNVILLGSGEKHYEEAFKYYEEKYPHNFRAILKFDNQLAHKIYASSDLFLMPSVFEPCGLAQMICLKYGTLPIVRETGGLKDSILSFNEYTNEGNGFSFANYNRDDFMYTIYRALGFYNQKEKFDIIISNAFECDFSWNASCKKYIQLYKELIKKE